MAAERALEELERAAAEVRARRPAPFAVLGEEDGDRLTHLLLAIRIRKKMDAGADLIHAFREVMADVRSVLRND